jgi:hypothetical protein
VYLMLAPAAALAPALGETGRGIFRKWAVQLFAAVVSKLLFAFLLGVVLAILGILEHLQALGWWTRWLLMSAFWWGLFARRHQVTQLATSGAGGEERARGARRPVLRRVNGTLDARARKHQRARDAKQRSRERGPELTRETARTPRGLPTGGTAVGTSGSPSVSPGANLGDAGRGGPAASAAGGSRAASRSDGARVRPEARPNEHPERAAEATPVARLRLLADQGAQALAAGNPRRAAQLAARERRIEAEARSQVGGERRPARALGRDRVDAEARHARFLDAQARLAAGGEDDRRGRGGARSYAALAGIAGYAPREYRRLDPAGRQAARELIDRELTARREHAPLRLDRRPAVRPRSESEVMRHAREVAAGRKRQLGPGRP